MLKRKNKRRRTTELSDCLIIILRIHTQTGWSFEGGGGGAGGVHKIQLLPVVDGTLKKNYNLTRYFSPPPPPPPPPPYQQPRMVQSTHNRGWIGEN